MPSENTSEEQKYREITKKILDKTKNPDKYIIYRVTVLKDESYTKFKFLKISAIEKLLDGKIVMSIEVAKDLTEDNEFLKIFEKGLLKSIEKNDKS